MAKQHRTVKGKPFNMDDVRAANGTTRAYGSNMNARGDLLDDNGNIIKYRHEIVQEYYNTNPNAVKHISLKDKISSIPVMQPEDLTKALNDMKNKQTEKENTNSEEKKSRKLVDKEDDNNE